MGNKSVATSVAPGDAVDAPEPTQSPEPNQPKGWLESLPSDLQSHETLKKFKDVDGLAKSYVELEGRVGGAVKLPNEKSTPEEWAAFYDRLGRPSKPDGYELKAPESLPAGVEWSDELAKSFSEIAHKHGLTKTQAGAVAEFWGQIVSKQAETFWTHEKGMAALETNLKSKEAVNAHISSVQRAVKELADEPFKQMLNETGLGNRPEMLNFLAKIGKMFDEDTLPQNFESESASTSVDEARSRIAQIRNDKAHPYHKGDPAAVAEMNKLYEVIKGRKVVMEVR